jgi:hypothetical protein
VAGCSGTANYVDVAIDLPAGVEEEAVLEAILGQVTRVAELLAGLDTTDATNDGVPVDDPDGDPSDGGDPMRVASAKRPDATSTSRAAPASSRPERDGSSCIGRPRRQDGRGDADSRLHAVRVRLTAVGPRKISDSGQRSAHVHDRCRLSCRRLPALGGSGAWSVVPGG